MTVPAGERAFLREVTERHRAAYRALQAEGFSEREAALLAIRTDTPGKCSVCDANGPRISTRMGVWCARCIWDEATWDERRPAETEETE